MKGPRYHFWDGAQEYPADPADCVFYVVPYMKAADVGVRPLPLMSSVEVVQTLSAGVDHVQPGLRHLGPGVRLCNARGVHGEHGRWRSLSSWPRCAACPTSCGHRRGEWLGGFRPALADRNVLVVGYGAIGAAIEDRLVPFELARVARVARSARTAARGPVHPFTDLPALLPEADVVILSTPLTEATHHLVDAGFLARMKDGALLVNVARGPVVDTSALLTEVESGRITAALDVTDPEPLPGPSPVAGPGRSDHPHVGGPTSAFRPRAERLLVDQLNRFVNREELRNVILVTEAVSM
ncbi:2-hydroxyacid dehydrogenase [Streptomyces hirsutus]